MNLQNTAATKEHLAGVLYCSEATDEMSRGQLHQIVKTSQKNNVRRGITGFLAYGGGMFVQWLEEPFYEVRKLLAALASDSRHETIVRLQKLTSIRKRLYPSWSMQYVAPGAVREAMYGCFRLTRDLNDQELSMRMIELLEKDRCPANKRPTRTVPQTKFNLIASVGSFVNSRLSTN